MWQLGAAADRPNWRVVDTRLDCDLHAVVETVDGPYAVGGSGTVAANRGSGWEVVFEDGPATSQSQLQAVDATDDGKRIWLVGTGGTVAYYDVERRRKFDFAYPEKLAPSLEGIAVSGPRGGEKALAATGSGEMLPFAVDGTDPDWGQLDRVAESGATIAVLASTPEGVGFAVDTAGNAVKTTPTAGWTDIGVVDTRATFSDVYAGAGEQVYVAASDGRLYRYGSAYHSWTPISVGAAAGIRSVDLYDAGDGRSQMTVLGDDGTIYERTAPDRWEELPAPTHATLHSLSLGEPDVIVGERGTVVERSRETARGATTPPGDRVTEPERRADQRVGTE